MSPDTVSSLFPDRPIRPLPKRRLRERLSPEVAESIKYPSSTLNSVPLFQYPPVSWKEDEARLRPETISQSEPFKQPEAADEYFLRGGGRFAAGEEAGATTRSTFVTRSSPEILSRTPSQSTRPDPSRSSTAQQPPSTASSVDGYDSFENTNNKKKRKIPTAGDPALNPAHALNMDMNSHVAATGTASPSGAVHGDRSFNNTAGYATSGNFGTNNQGISGSGRGRLGRSRNGRSPLRALSDGNNASAGRPSKEIEGSGIISNAIANAEKLPPQGQENVSLLQQHSTRTKTTPSASQFTFTCDSQVTGTLHWPVNSKYTDSDIPNGSQTTMNEEMTRAAQRRERRKHRRQVEKELARAADHRRQLTSKRNRNNPPKPDDMWICEFCEYEAIFGEPPRALIRDYELKDRRFRQEEADRKRLLEKAKQKARKGKKNGKPVAKGGSPSHQNDPNQPDDYDNPPVPTGNEQSEDEEEDAYTAEYDEPYTNSQPQNMLGIEDDGGGGGGSGGGGRGRNIGPVTAPVGPD